MTDTLLTFPFISSIPELPLFLQLRVNKAQKTHACAIPLPNPLLTNAGLLLETNGKDLFFNLFIWMVILNEWMNVR